MGEDGGRAPGRARKKPVRWSEALAKRLCARLAGGELLYRILAEDGMPTAEGVAKWAKERPEFGEALLAARRAGGRPAGTRGCPFTYTEEIGEEIFERLCEGQSLTGIGRDPTMPSLSTIFYWRRRIPDFEERVQLGMRVRAEIACDTGWELAREATRETAYLTDVRLKQLRWMAGVMAPRVFKLKTVEPEKPVKTVDVMFRHFEIEVDKATGERRVVAWCPNPATGFPDRESEPDFRFPPGLILPDGRG